MNKNHNLNEQARGIAFLATVKKFFNDVVNEFRQAQAELDAVREKMEQRSK